MCAAIAAITTVAKSSQPGNRCGALSAPEAGPPRDRPAPVTRPFTLAVDAMGGDHAPEMVIDGLELAAERHPEARFLLIGDESRLSPLLSRKKRDVQPTPQNVS